MSKGYKDMEARSYMDQDFAAEYVSNREHFSFTHTGTDFEALEFSKLDMILYVYGRILAHLLNARNSYEKAEFKKGAKDLDKALELVTDLHGTLNFEEDTDLANHLETLYVFIAQKICNAAFNQRISEIDDAMDIVGMLKNNFQTAKSRMNVKYIN